MPDRSLCYGLRTMYAGKLTRSAVIEAGRAVAEREGIAGLSMRAVARELGASPMGLYRHVADKEDLLDGLVELLLGELRVPEQSLPWETRLRILAHELRALARRHPGLFELLLRRRAVGAGALGAREAVQRALIDAGLTPEAAARRERLLSTTIMGFSLSEVAGRFAGFDADREFEEALDLLAGVADGS
jgi:AcrR family transcriptional regulator